MRNLASRKSSLKKLSMAMVLILPMLSMGELRDFIEFLPSCKRHYVDNDKLNNRTWDRAWTIRDERFNNVTNLFLDIDHPETFPRELFDSATSAGAVRGCFGWGKRAVDPRFADDVEPCT